MTTTIRGRSTRTTLSLPVLVGTPDFELFDLGRTVDRMALEKGSHRLVVGRIKADCCANLLRARIADGRVVGIEVERCKKSVPLDQHVSRTLQRAMHRLRGRKPRGFHSIPIAQFLRPAVLRQTLTNSVQENCWIVCIPTIDLHHQVCYLCCIGRDPVAPEAGSDIRWCLPFGGEPKPWPTRIA